eukprot:gb/GEZJ01005791.1/.p2 GENE.gb/GEZJ01005791.1/~~gb/GEZJ01005791.1/.p2  ORF type:complete len:210 (-),score=12.34 gb/GEZJ01005791.1/:120-749(-)
MKTGCTATIVLLLSALTAVLRRNAVHATPTAPYTSRLGYELGYEDPSQFEPVGPLGHEPESGWDSSESPPSTDSSEPPFEMEVPVEMEEATPMAPTATPTATPITTPITTPTATPTTMPTTTPTATPNRIGDFLGAGSVVTLSDGTAVSSFGDNTVSTAASTEEGVAAANSEDGTVLALGGPGLSAGLAGVLPPGVNPFAALAAPSPVS